ncbi:MAG: hypothetical protein IIY21_25010 [Clostridiales bacterium]|nr:hypothetical protein [Clostridiales bacterium]MBQ1575027.1 hypothetical protein [Clostridiales bacterium]
MDKKISELDQALQINNDAVFPISQDNGGTDTTYKVSITQISAEVGEDQTFSNLQTTSKKLVGAINELYQGGGGGGSSTLAGLNDVDIDDQTLSEGQVLKYDSAEDKWINDDVGAGGHTIVADDGTDLTQRANLQFIGAYSEDNSVDDTTEVNVVRNMTKAQFDLLTADEKTGFINTTDETSQIYATEIPMSALDSDTVAEKLDEKVDTTDFYATNLPIESGSATNTKDYIDSKTTYETNSYNVSIYGGVIKCKKWGRIVNVQGYSIGSTEAVPAGSAYTFTTIASKYRPTDQQHFMGFANAGSYKYDAGQGYRINTDGTVVVYVYSGTTFNNGSFNITYIV